MEVGDRLVQVSGDSTEVTNISIVRRYGAFAPFTTSGKVAVNGVVTSCYVSLQDKSDVLVIGNIENAPFYALLVCVSTELLLMHLWLLLFVAAGFASVVRRYHKKASAP
jgi:hypothetical protein